MGFLDGHYSLALQVLFTLLIIESWIGHCGACSVVLSFDHRLLCSRLLPVL
jgi:hypothetical protein